ncbi:MAG: transcriptional regulator [Bacteroidota bacterium]
MPERTLRVGIMSQEQYKARTLAIARGQYQPKRGEPKVWFESLQSMAQILSAENQELLRIILERKPVSIHDLEIATGRRSSNLSRTLKTLARYGIVELSKEERSVKPVVKATEFKVTFGLNLSHRSAT